MYIWYIYRICFCRAIRLPSTTEAAYLDGECCFLLLVLAWVWSFINIESGERSAGYDWNHQFYTSNKQHNPPILFRGTLDESTVIVCPFQRRAILAVSSILHEYIYRMLVSACFAKSRPSIYNTRTPTSFLVNARSRACGKWFGWWNTQTYHSQIVSAENV